MQKLRAKFVDFFVDFIGDTKGATALEYGLIAALMAVVSIAAFTALGGGLENIFGSTSTGAGEIITDAASSL